VALSFSGGDGGRSSVVTVECADVRRPQVVRWVSGAMPGSYTALVRARAGCALECERDAATGAVCGGEKRGACMADGAGGNAHCKCSGSHAGALCAELSHAPSIDAGGFSVMSGMPAQLMAAFAIVTLIALLRISGGDALHCASGFREWTLSPQSKYCTFLSLVALVAVAVVSSAGSRADSSHARAISLQHASKSVNSFVRAFDEQSFLECDRLLPSLQREFLSVLKIDVLPETDAMNLVPFLRRFYGTTPRPFLIDIGANIGYTSDAFMELLCAPFSEAFVLSAESGRGGARGDITACFGAPEEMQRGGRIFAYEPMVC
jgi:hypothetical protein